jgi:hypothetical protein
MTHLASWKRAPVSKSYPNPNLAIWRGTSISKQTFSADTFQRFAINYIHCSNRFGAQPSSTTLSAIRHNTTWRRTEM